MTDSAAKLRRLLADAHDRIRQLEAIPAPDPVVIEREVIREVPGPERVVEVQVPFEVERVVYRDVPIEVIKEVPGPERIVDRVVTEYIDREVERLVPFEVERVEMVEVIKEVEVPIAMYPPSVQRVEIENVVYVDNPDHIETIRRLQERLCQLTSQSDS